jgi:Zn-dependent protease
MSRKSLSWIALAVSLLSVLVLVPTCVHAASVKTQLCLVVDGSNSISSSEWSIIKQALAKAVNETIHHDGSVELTIVQFGYSPTEGYAKTELQPTTIDSANYARISAQIQAMPKGNSETPTAHGLYLGWTELKNSPNSGSGAKKVINLATDGIPNVRNNNATSDLDCSNGSPNPKDDVIATVNNAVAQGLQELDIEAIGISETNSGWLKNWTVYPQPGITAPPFTKPGWIRIVADPTEFANTIGQKMQVVISGSADAWVPSAEGALAAGLVTVGATSIVSYLGSAVSNPSSGMAQKISNLFPEILKRWLHKFISSKRKLLISPKTGSPFSLTKLEIVSYVVALVILTFAFAYAKAPTLDEMLTVIPTVLATSIIVEFVKNFAVEAIARKQGVWTEHRLWYFGLAAFLFSTLAFRVPFSSPSRNIHYSQKFTKRSLGLVSAASVFLGFIFAVIFYFVLVSGFALIGSIGLVMSLTMAFFEALPIPPMNGKDIYDWNKLLWMGLFVATFALYMLCLLLI